MLSSIIKAGAAIGGLGLGVGALVYEGALNTKLVSTFSEMFRKPDAEQDALYASDYYVSAENWFNENKGEDNVIFSEKTGNTHAYIIMSETPSDKWIVLNHGYTSAPEGTCVFTREFHNMGFNCICPSMRGFANDEGHYCSMGYYDRYICLAWVNYISAKYPDAQIIIHGYSMGAATTMLTLGEELPDNVKCAISDCGYTNCYEQYTYVLKHNASLPAFPILDLANTVSKLKGNFDFKESSPIDAIKKSKTPTLFIHGSKDDFVPFYMLDKLFDACKSEKQKLVIEGGLHATSVVKNPELYWSTVKEFIAKYIK